MSMDATPGPTTEVVSQPPKPKATRPPFWRAETIGQKLTLGFLLILTLLAASGLVAYLELSVVGKDARSMEAASMQAMSASHLERLAETSLIPVHDYLLTGDPASKAEFDRISAELDGEVALLQGKPASGAAAMAGMSGMSGSPASGTSAFTKLSSEQLVLLNNFNDKWMEMHDQAEAIFKIQDPVGNADGIAQLKAMESSASTMAAYAQSIHEFQMQNVSLNQASANAVINSTSLFLAGAVMVAFLLGALLSRIIGRAISRPVARLTEVSSNISLGDLDTKVEVQAGGEIGELAVAIERMRTSLKMIIERLSEEEEDMRTWSAQLASRELRRKVRGGYIALGGQKYEVGRELDGQFVNVKLDYDMRQLVITPPFGAAKYVALRS